MDPKISVDFDDDGEADLELKTSQIVGWVTSCVTGVIALVTSLMMMT